MWHAITHLGEPRVPLVERGEPAHQDLVRQRARLGIEQVAVIVDIYSSCW